jgi:tetratricopeptide (TPR) repeat protein
MRKFFESIITFISATVVCLIASVWYYKTCDIKLLLTAITAGGGAICSLFAIFKDKREATINPDEIAEKVVEKFTNIQNDKKRIKQLEELLTNTEEQLTFQRLNWGEEKQALEADVARKEEQIKQIIKQYENADTVSSDLYQTAFRLFMDGKLDEALAMLSDAALTEEETKKLEEVVKPRILKAQLLELNYDFEAAEANYLKAITIFPSFDNNLVLANFYQNLNKFQEAEKFYNQCLVEAKLPDERAMTLNNLGNLQSDRNEQEKAEAAYTEALEIYRQLANVNPKTYLPYVATTLNNLGNLQFDRNEQEKAEDAYTEALDIRRQFAKVNPQIYLPYVAMALYNLGDLQFKKNEQKKAEIAYTEALAIFIQFAKVNPKTYLPYVAMTLNYLGNMRLNENKLEEAKTAYAEALDIRRQFAKINPQTYLPDVAMTLLNIGNLQSDENKLEKAEESYKEALNIYRQFAKINSQTYLPDVAKTLNNLGILQEKRNEQKKAAAAYTEALEIYRQLANVNSQTYLPYVAGTLINLSRFYQKNLPNQELSLKYVREAIECLLPFQEIPYIQRYFKSVFYVVKDWGIDVEEYLKENGFDF